MKNKLRVAALFTDIHFGKRANSKDHNEDCLNFIQWFCDQVRANPDIDHIIFMGDWHETRSALSISTMHYSYRGAKMLNELGLPIFFLVGNHDLHHRHDREVHSVIFHNEFSNFAIIDQPTIVEDILGGALLSPYLFHSEYGDMFEHADIPNWFGHFEFKGFQITGYNVIMPVGPDPEDFAGPKNIFSGHFHKRQEQLNVRYIGNTFPMDFSDAGDFNRGMAIHDFVSNSTSYINWSQCPKFIKTTLSDILDKSVIIQPFARVRCMVDIPISFEESTYIRQKFIEDFKLREFSLEETHEIADALVNTTTTVDVNDDMLGLDDLVVQMLHDVDVEKLDSRMLVDIYKQLHLS